MRLSMLALPLLLCACGAGENDPGPGSVTQGEARELNEAAEMLDANSVSTEVLGNQGDGK